MEGIGGARSPRRRRRRPGGVPQPPPRAASRRGRAPAPATRSQLAISRGAGGWRTTPRGTTSR